MIARVPVYGRGGVVAHAIVDARDLAVVSKHRWSLATGGYVKSSSLRSDGRRGIKLHRLITGAPAGSVVDHANHDPLDNRRCNLRVCSQAENARNRLPNKGRGLPKGVHRRFSKWHARIRIGGRLQYLGTFKTIDAASAAYERAAAIHFGQFALNTKASA